MVGGSGATRADVFAAGWIGLSATAYLVAFGSNLAAGLEYYRLARTSPSKYAWVAISYAVMLLAAHSFTALIFRFHIRDPSFSTALFLPLLQLSRLVRLILAAFSLRGIAEIESTEKSTLFGFMAAAVETAPHLQLQLAVILLKFNEGQVSKLIWLSLFGSFFSGVVNNVMALASVSAYHSWSLWHKMLTFMAAGFFTMAVLLLGCLSFIGISMWKGLPVRVLFLSVPPVIMCMVYMWVWKEEDIGETIFSKLVRAFILGYASLTVGPMYPLAYHANGRKEHGAPAHLYRLLLTGSCLLAFYVLVFVICFWGPISWSMIWYMVLLDQSWDGNVQSEREKLAKETCQVASTPGLLYRDVDVVSDKVYAEESQEGYKLLGPGNISSAAATTPAGRKGARLSGWSRSISTNYGESLQLRDKCSSKWIQRCKSLV